MDHTDGLQTTIRRVTARVSRFSPRDAEDLVQEALARAISHGVSPDAEAWLSTVARRIAIDRSRRAREISSGGAAELEGLGSERELGPEESLLRSERAEDVRRALAVLPKRYRDALLVYLEEDESPAAVARRFGLSPNAAWTLLSRARSRLRAELEKMGVVPAAIWFRLQRWQNELAAGGAVAAIAVAVAVVTSPAPPTPTPVSAPPVRSVEAIVGAPVAASDVPAAPARVAPVAETRATTAVQQQVLDPAKTPAKHTATVCSAKTGTELALGVRFEDPEEKYVLGDVFRRLPGTVRYSERGQC